MPRSSNHFAILCTALMGTTVAPIIMSSRADAVPVTYTETTLATGIIGGIIPFNNAVVTFTFTGDTANIFSPSPRIYEIDSDTLTFQVLNYVEHVVLVNDTYDVYDNQIDGIFGFGDAAQDSTITGTAPFQTFFYTYNLASSFGPTESASAGAVPASYPEELDPPSGIFGATLEIDSFGPLAYFSAQVSSSQPPTAVPEPSSLALLGAGLVSLGLLRFCRLRAS